MQSLFTKINNNYPSIFLIEKIFLNKTIIKNSNNFILNKKYIDSNIRINKLINFYFLIQINEINKFNFDGRIIKKHKKYNLSNSVTARTLLSGKYVNITFHLCSPGIRIV